MDEYDIWFDGLGVEKILQWIIIHRENTAEMDAINKIVFPFSSKFARKANYGNQANNGGI